jgi:hypothetical protein
VARHAAVAVCLGLAASLAVAGAAGGQERVQGDVFTNTRYGIRIGKPSSWHFLTAGLLVDLARKAGGGPPIRGDEDPVRLAGFAVIVSKVPNLGREIAPQVVLLVHELKAAPTDLVKTCEGLRSGMLDPETVAPTREVRVGSRPAVRLEFRGIVDGASVRAVALCTVRDRTAVVAAAQALASEFEAEIQAFESVLSSFRLE